MKYRIDATRLRLKDLVALETMQNFAALRDVIARTLVDENGKPYSEERANEIAGDLTIAEINEFAQKLQEAVKAQIVPPKSGGE